MSETSLKSRVVLYLTECKSILTNLAVVSSKSSLADTRVVVNVIHAGSTIEASVVNTVVDIFKAKQNVDKMHEKESADSHQIEKYSKKTYISRG